MEIWHDVIGFEGSYRISNWGRVYSFRSQRILKCITNHKYKQVMLGWNDNKRKAGVHQLVAEAFLLPDPYRPHVNHIDGNPANNHYTNLEYVTPRENQLHAYKTGLRKPMIGEKHFNARLTEEDVRFIRKSKGKLTLKELAVKYSMGWKYIWEVQSGKRWKEVA